MVFLPSLSPEELRRYHGVISQAAKVRTHFDVLVWLQGDMQQYLAHDIMIAAWGDFDQGAIQHDIISALDGVRSQSSNLQPITPLLLDLFRRWTDFGGKLFTVAAGDQGFALEKTENPCALTDALQKMQCAMVHCISDVRGSYDCLYAAFRANGHFTESEQAVMAVALPYIDIALRQVKLLPHQNTAPPVISTPLIYDLLQSRGLSAREIEILQWVARGKTNPEIGQILKRSEFTVKNHMQRIFKKMDVRNRAQAVGLFKTLVSNA
jgi:transcriptional regulator EpsA